MNLTIQEILEKKPLLKNFEAEITSYLASVPTVSYPKHNFTSVKKYLENMTPFEKTVLKQICGVKFGQVASYHNIALKINKPNAYRAVARVCSVNPLPIIIPCHRIIKSNGTIGGYIFGSELKELLIECEKNTYFEAVV